VRQPEATQSRVAEVGASLARNRDSWIALLALLGIGAHLWMRYAVSYPRSWSDAPLLVVLAVGGAPLVVRLVSRAVRGEFGADHLAAVSIAASVLLGEYLAGSIVVLMLAGGDTLEHFAVAEATSVLRALARRVPTIAHRWRGNALEDVAVSEIAVGDDVSILPHEVCPVDALVIEGHGTMDESFLTGEPFIISKGPGTKVLSGAVNGEAPLRVRATRLAADSRFAQIVQVMQDAEQRRPALRRIGDQLGAWYTPAAITVAGLAWYASGDPLRFLSVVVIATPCPLLIAIPVAIIGAISTAARRGVIVKDPAALEQLTLCRTMILDKTGTLTYGRPALSDEIYLAPFTRDRVLPAVAAIERYSRHPLAAAIVQAAADAGSHVPDVEWVREEPGSGLRARVDELNLELTSRARLAGRFDLPPAEPTGLECIVVRPFNHIGPGQAPGFILPDFFKRLVLMSAPFPGPPPLVSPPSLRMSET